MPTLTESPITFDKSEIQNILGAVVDEAQKLGFERQIGNIVVAGGGALCLKNVRDTSQDLDVYLPVDLQALTDRVEARFPGLVIDVTTDDRFWGRIHTSRPLLEPLAVTGRDGTSQYHMRVLSMEELFIRKGADSCREKDIQDLARIAPHTTPERIVSAFRALIGTNDRWEMRELADILLSELSATYGKPVTRELVEGLGFPKKETSEMLQYWGLDRDKDKSGKNRGDAFERE